MLIEPACFLPYCFYFGKPANFGQVSVAFLLVMVIEIKEGDHLNVTQSVP